MRSLLTAIRTLTILPCPGREAENLAAALPLFPFVGLLVGGLVAAALWLCMAVFNWPLDAAILGVVFNVWLTRALHLDGVGDVADALAGGRTIERRLEIMKDPRLGAFGVIAIACVLLLKVAAFDRILFLGAWWWIPVPFVVSRAMQVIVITLLPYARPEGGTAGAFVQGARPAHLAAALALAAGLCVLLAGIIGLAIFAAAAILSLLLSGWMRRHFGGVTGDLVGLTNELFETGLLLALAAAAPYLRSTLWILQPGWH
jgi:adenosylcobinamide-GDP ribazoletransferase